MPQGIFPRFIDVRVLTMCFCNTFSNCYHASSAFLYSICCPHFRSLHITRGVNVLFKFKLRLLKTSELPGEPLWWKLSRVFFQEDLQSTLDTVLSHKIKWNVQTWHTSSVQEKLKYISHECCHRNIWETLK